MAWLVTVRWTTLAACAGALVAGAGGLGVRAPLAAAAGASAAVVLTNTWLMWRIRRGAPVSALVAGVCISADVALLTWLLLMSGGALNPASAFYLVQIVVTALVLGRRWTAVVTALSVGGYAALFLFQTDELRAAQGMHPEIATHMRGMWLAFALVAIVISVLVTRLALAIERRDLALDALRDRSARASRAAGLASVVAGAAHELGTPLATIAVAAHELELALADQDADADAVREDARLIREEIDRCRALLTGMAGRVSLPFGQAPARLAVSSVIETVLSRLPSGDRARVQVTCPAADVRWPLDVVAQALGNVVRNALQASPPNGGIDLRAAAFEERVEVVVEDRGQGMTAETAARAGEPFFTTKPEGIGIGLGLFVARSSVEQLGGRLELVSIPGQGTAVTITIPRDVVDTVHA
jgi:two-component system sensor histidine kinase RegB